MQTSSYRVRQTEIATIEHNGRQHSAGGCSVHGREVCGYLAESGALTTWTGGQLLPPGRHHEWANIQWGEFCDEGSVIGWRLACGRWIVGWAMHGAGSLVRAELIQADDESDARYQAKQIANYWIDIDIEEQARDQAEQAALESEDPERFDGQG